MATVSKTNPEKWLRQIFLNLKKLNLLIEVTLIRDIDTTDTHETVTDSTPTEYYNQYAFVDITTAENYEQFDIGVVDIGSYVLYCEPTFFTADESEFVQLETGDKIQFQDSLTHETVTMFVKTIQTKHQSHIIASLTKTP